MQILWILFGGSSQNWTIFGVHIYAFTGLFLSSMYRTGIIFVAGVSPSVNSLLCDRQSFNNGGALWFSDNLTEVLTYLCNVFKHVIKALY